MMDASEKLDFERAKEYRDLIQHIHNLTKTKIMSSDNTIRDVFVTMSLKDGCAFKSSLSVKKFDTKRCYNDSFTTNLKKKNLHL